MSSQISSTIVLINGLKQSKDLEESIEERNVNDRECRPMPNMKQVK